MSEASHGDSSSDSKHELPKDCKEYGQLLKYGIFRRKSLSADLVNLLQTELRRCLRTFELLAYGTASMLGGSIYVLIGAIIINHTGPGAFVAYILAGIIAGLNSTIYSELACRIPKAGSSYSYAYILLGELPAFLTGWSILLEYILGAASIARGWSSMLDGLTHNAISNWTIRNVGRIGQPGSIFAPCPDLIGMLLIIVIVIIACLGVKGGARFTAIFIAFNILVLMTTSIFMYVFADPRNLTINIPSSVTTKFANVGSSNFLPFGVAGLLSGTAICFNAFIGFDAISTCAEETRSPNKSIPSANFLAVVIVTIVTLVAALALTLYIPWFTLSVESPFLSAFSQHRASGGGSPEARRVMFYFVGVGALIGLISSLVSNFVAGPRIAYAMAEDGLLPRFCSRICQPFQTPVTATILMAIITIILEMLFSIESLADFLSLGTLIAYSMASIGILILRYTTPPEYRKLSDKEMAETKVADDSESDEHDNDKNPLDPDDSILNIGKPGFVKARWNRFLCDSSSEYMNSGRPGQVAMSIIGVYLFINIGLMLCIKLGTLDGRWPLWLIIVVPVLVGIMLICIILLSAFKQYGPIHRGTFRIPYVPFFPCLTLSANLILIFHLSWMTWVRYAVWIAIGILIYLLYGVCHSKAAQRQLANGIDKSIKDEIPTEHRVEEEQRQEPSSTGQDEEATNEDTN